MQNDYGNRIGQTQKDRGNDYPSSGIKQGTEKVKDKVNEIAGETQKQLKEGQEQASQIIGALDKQVRENPWPVIAGVAIGAFLLGSLSNRSK